MGRLKIKKARTSFRSPGRRSKLKFVLLGLGQDLVNPGPANRTGTLHRRTAVLHLHFLNVLHGRFLPALHTVCCFICHKVGLLLSIKVLAAGAARLPPSSPTEQKGSSTRTCQD